MLGDIVNQIFQGVLIVGPDGLIRHANQAICDMTGYSEAELIGRNSAFLEGPGSDPHTAAAMADCIARGESFRGEVLNYRKTGEAFWNDLSITPIRDDTGVVSHFIVLQRDVSALRQAKSDLRLVVEDDRSMFDLVLAGLVVHGADTAILYANATAERLLGVNPGETLGVASTDPRWGFLREDGSPMPIAEYPNNRAMATRADVKNLVLGIRHRNDGRLAWVMCNAYPELDASGRPARVIVTFTDVTDLKQAERSLKESEERLRLVLLGSGDASWDWDVDRDRIHYAPRWWEMLGYEDGALPATSALWRELTHPDDVGAGLARVDAAIEDGAESFETEFRLRHERGHYVPMLSRGVILRGVDGRALRVAGTITDLTERKQVEEKIRNLAFYDPLTNLPNRRLFVEQLRRALLAGPRSGRMGALLFVDLDRFKSLNDTMGHDIGDRLLEQVAGRLTGVVRQCDLVARLGGDEFLVMIENLPADPRGAAREAERVAAKILAALREPYVLGEHRHLSTPSIGVAVFGKKAVSVEAVIKQADLAMYQAKAKGRNRVQFFDPSLQVTVEKRVALERDLREALGRQQLVLHAQPQTRDDGRVIGAELLARWPHPRRGLVMPSEFIPLAETTGLIFPLSRWTLRECCALLSRWTDAPMGQVRLALNISARQFREPDFELRVLETLEAFGVDPHRLTLEVSESLMANNIDEVVPRMNRLRDRGVGISLDDFGAGSSSLSSLRRMPLTQLKIDRSFIGDALSGEANAVIVRIIIDLAEKLALELIAVGVETQAQREFLIDNGCRIFQGYLLGRPAPVDSLERQVSDADPVAE